MLNILIIGVKPGGKGGVSTVIGMQLAVLSAMCNVYHLSSTSGTSKLQKIFSLLFSLIKLPFILATRQIDLVHIHGSMKGSFFRKSCFLIICKIFGKKVIYHMHSPAIEHYFTHRPAWKLTLVKYLFNRYDAIIALGDHWKTVLLSVTGTHTVAYSVSNAIGKCQLPMACKTGKFILFVIGEVGHRKGTYDIIKIAKRLLTHKDIEFRIAGGGADLEPLKRQCSAEGLDGMITWLGWVGPEVRDQEMANADIFFLPSYHEGMPMAILEGMCADLPVISTPVGGIPDCVIDGKTGYLVEPGNIELFSERILHLKNNPHLLLSMSKASAERASTVFSPEQFAQNVMSVYRKVLNLR